MTYKKRKYESEAWKRQQKLKTCNFIKEFIIALGLVIAGTVIGVYLGQANLSSWFTIF